MKDYLPYIVSIIAATLSFVGSLIICRKNSKADIEKMKLEHIQILERNKQEQDARIAQLEKEYALKAGTQMVTSFADKTLDAVYSTPAVREELNKRAFQSISHKKGRRKRK